MRRKKTYSKNSKDTNTNTSLVPDTSKLLFIYLIVLGTDPLVVPKRGSLAFSSDTLVLDGATVNLYQSSAISTPNDGVRSPSPQPIFEIPSTSSFAKKTVNSQSKKIGNVQSISTTSTPTVQSPPINVTSNKLALNGPKASPLAFTSVHLSMQDDNDSGGDDDNSRRNSMFIKGRESVNIGQTPRSMKQIPQQSLRAYNENLRQTRQLAQKEYEWLATVMERCLFIVFVIIFAALTSGINLIGYLHWSDIEDNSLYYQHDKMHNTLNDD